MSDDERRARVAAQFDQVRAEGAAMVDDPAFSAAFVAWIHATEVLTRAHHDLRRRPEQRPSERPPAEVAVRAE